MSEKNILNSWTNFKKINADKLSKNNTDEYYDKYPTTKFKDFTREQKDEVIKAMKNPNVEHGFLTKNQSTWHDGPIENLTEQGLKKDRELERQHRKKHSSYY